MSKPNFTDADKKRFRKAGESDRWYVVQVGRNTGPRRGWSGRGGCEESVKGFRGAIFHGGWASRSEAEDFWRTTDAFNRGGDDKATSDASRSRSRSRSRSPKRIRYRRPKRPERSRTRSSSSATPRRRGSDHSRSRSQSRSAKSRSGSLSRSPSGRSRRRSSSRGWKKSRSRDVRRRIPKEESRQRSRGR